MNGEVTLDARMRGTAFSSLTRRVSCCGLKFTLGRKTGDPRMRCGSSLKKRAFTFTFSQMLVKPEASIAYLVDRIFRTSLVD